MYKVFYTNHDYFSVFTFETVNAAIKYGENQGFEFQVYNRQNKLIASWSQSGGLRYW